MTDEDEYQADMNSSAPVLGSLKKAEREFEDWQRICHDIDATYSLHSNSGTAVVIPGSDGWQDSKFDLFWSSYEVMKPAIYTRPPVPAVKPAFSDNNPVYDIAGELLERATITTFRQTKIHEAMCCARDDILFSGRGVLWVRYDTDDGQKVCIEHIDRTDFLHEPARKWEEVGWVARRAWLTKEEMRERFEPTSGDAYLSAQYRARKDDEYYDDTRATVKKAGVWEVWNKADNKVCWVSEGVDVYLDESEPYLTLSEFWPCPKPAYATLRRRSLVPVPDWERYALHFKQVSVLTGRIYLLLNQVRMMGLIPAGGDIGDAVEEAMASEDEHILIPVPGAALMASGGSANFVQWIPLMELATAIQGLLQARMQIIDDFYQLSGIADIMRGATDANETLGAQQLKSQYGSVRVRCKIEELQRIAADAAAIAAEIIAEKFDKDTLLEMSCMEILPRSAITKRVKDIETAAEKELKALGEKAEEMAAMQMQQAQQMHGTTQSPEAQQMHGDPQQVQQMLQQAQQQILQKYAPLLMEAESRVPMEDVMKLLRDDRARGFTFEIETDSTILTDELQEKASRNEFLQQFMASSQSLMQMTAMGEEGAKLAGELLKFVLAPYRVGRQLNSVIDEFIKAAPEMAAKAQAEQGGGEDAEALIAANNKLADAEMAKAQAAMAKVEADTALKQAETQRKLMEMQQKAQTDATKYQADIEKLRQSGEETEAKLAKTLAEVEKLQAETVQILNSIGLAERQQALSETQAVVGQVNAERDREERAGEAERSQINVDRDREERAAEAAAGNVGVREGAD